MLLITFAAFALSDSDDIIIRCCNVIQNLSSSFLPGVVQCDFRLRIIH